MERFYEKVDAGPGGGCHLWMASTTSEGYGQLWVGDKNIGAHRIAWELRNGPIPDGLCVLHTCDRRECVNPNHMFLGTRADNAEDRDAKGRHKPGRGERHGNSKLTEADVRAIRADPRLHREIAVDYETNRSNVGSIKRRNTWRHLP